MIGLTEIIVILLIIGLIALFGRKTIKKLAKDFFSVKKDIEAAKKEFADESK